MPMKHELVRSFDPRHAHGMRSLVIRHGRKACTWGLPRAAVKIPSWHVQSEMNIIGVCSHLEYRHQFSYFRLLLWQGIHSNNWQYDSATNFLEMDRTTDFEPIERLIHH
jgi:hypothetical protein